MIQGAGLLSLCLLAGVSEKPASVTETSEQARQPRAVSRQAEPADSPFSLLPVAPGQTRGAATKEASGPVVSALPTDAPAWLRQHGTGGIDQGTGIAASCEGVYSVGYTNGGFDGNVSAGGMDMFLVKHDPNGTKLWSRQLGTPVQDYAVGVASFDLGGDCKTPVLYVTGYTTGGIDNNASAGGIDGFLTKYDKSGTKLWTRQFGSASNDHSTSVATDKNGNVYVVGYTIGAFATTSAGGQDLFIVKYDAAGVQQWRRQLGTVKNDQARGVACDADGNVYVGGHTFGNLDGNTNAGGNTTTSDIFLTKYDGAGLKLWTKQLGTEKSEVAQGLASSRRLNGVVDVYLVGHTFGSFAGPNIGGYDALLVKFDSAGVTQWKKQHGTSGNDLLFGVTSDGGGSVYVTGTSPFDVTTNASLGSDDLFMMSFKEDGTFVKARQIGSVNPADPTFQGDSGAGIATDKANGVYIAGYTEGEYSGTTNAGDKDLLVLKYAEGCGYITPGKCHLGYGWGDPHYVTFDGYAYDFQGYGEFILAQSTSGDLLVQARQRAWGGSPYVSVFTAVAARIGTDRVAYYLGAAQPLKINGTAVTLTSETVLPGGGRIIPRGSGYTFAWPTGDHLVVSPGGSYLNVDLLVSPVRQGSLRGPLGNFNGNRYDDFVLRDGTALAAPLSHAQMYTGSTAYVNSWRITQAESLFDYAVGESTATFTNFDFPYVRPQLTTTQRDTATQTCQNAGVTDPATLEGCITDVAFTNDTTFATAAATVQTNTQTQGNTPPAQPAPQSIYIGNFENSAAGSVWSSQVTSSTPAGDRNFLGEFGNESVKLVVPSLPAHKTVTVSFDLYVLNGWDGNGPNGPSKFSLTADGLYSLVNTTFSNTSSTQSYPGNYPSSYAARSGAFERDTLYYPDGDTVYRLKYTFNHTASSLSLLFDVNNLSGITSEAWGLDNVEVQVQ